MDPDIPYPTLGPRQKCRICGLLLASYNTTGECFHHLPPEKNTTNWLIGVMQEVLTELGKKEKTKLSQPQEETSTSGEVVLSKELLESIVGIVAKEFGVTTDDVFARTRVPQIALARQVAMFLLREMSLSSVDIGYIFERDHTTVLHACEQIGEQEKSDGKLVRAFENIRAELSILLGSGSGPEIIHGN